MHDTFIAFDPESPRLSSSQAPGLLFVACDQHNGQTQQHNKPRLRRHVMRTHMHRHNEAGKAPSTETSIVEPQSSQALEQRKGTDSICHFILAIPWLNQIMADAHGSRTRTVSASQFETELRRGRSLDDCHFVMLNSLPPTLACHSAYQAAASAAFMQGFFPPALHRQHDVSSRCEQWRSPRSRAVQACVDALYLLQMNSAQRNAEIRLEGQRCHSIAVSCLIDDVNKAQPDHVTILAAALFLLCSEVRHHTTVLQEVHLPLSPLMTVGRLTPLRRLTKKFPRNLMIGNGMSRR